VSYILDVTDLCDLTQTQSDEDEVKPNP